MAIPAKPAFVIAGIDRPNPTFTAINKRTYKPAGFPKTFRYTGVGGSQASVNIEKKLRGVIAYVTDKCAAHAPCNSYFKTLTRGRTLAELLREGEILLGALVPKTGNWTDGPGYVSLPQANTAGRQIILNFMSVVAFDITDIAATLVHELAHVAGATTNADEPGHAIDAETALKHCLFPQQFDPGAIGTLLRRTGRGNTGAA